MARRAAHRLLTLLTIIAYLQATLFRKHGRRRSIPDADAGPTRGRRRASRRRPVPRGLGAARSGWDAESLASTAETRRTGERQTPNTPASQSSPCPGPSTVRSRLTSSCRV